MSVRNAFAICTGLLASFNVARAQNTTCATATPITNGTHWVLFNQGGDGFIDSPCHTTPGIGNDAQWFTYTAPYTGQVSIRSCMGAIDMQSRLTVFVGSCANLQCIAAADDNCMASPPIFDNTACKVTFDAVQGFTYYIEWDETSVTSSYQWIIGDCESSVQGTTYIDQNGNGSHDAGEPLHPLLLNIEPGGDYFMSTGDPYTRCTEIGSYIITPPPAPPNYAILPASRAYTHTLPGDDITGMDFALVPATGMFDGYVDLWGQDGWIGNNTVLYIDVTNIGTMPITPQVLLNLDPQVNFVSALPAPTNSAAQAASWALPEIQPGANVHISVTIFTSITAVPNGPMVHSVLLTIDEADVNASNNSDNMHRIAATSIDPNDKRVNETSITPDHVADQIPLEYEIRFQNTGTAPAVNIVVMDSLDADWDLGTFQMIGATHPYSLWMNGEVAVWTFANIMLADSTTNEPESHGSISYRMAPKTSLGLGDQLTNRADIYFDYNEAVLTNTTVTTVELESGTDEAEPHGELWVVPSPGTGQFQIRWAEGGTRAATLTVLDAVGRAVHQATLAGAQHMQPVDLRALQPGTYLAHVDDGRRTAHARFVIQK